MSTSITEKYGAIELEDFYLDSSTIDLLKMFIYDMKNINIIINCGQGSGKTSILNMMIKKYYGNHYNPSFCYENILYINNSKDQGINYFRTDVKTFCQTPCSEKSKRKIIAIDDIDNLNEQSQQVFRNYIDNYNHNVFFIFTCTNLQKIIESIQSRQTIIKIASVNKSKISHICNNIIKHEGLTIDNRAKEFLINISNNSIRVLFNYLEKFKLIGRDVAYEDAIKLCTNINFEDFNNYIDLVKKNKTDDAIKKMLTLYDDGYSVMDILDSFFIYIKVSEKITEEIKYEIIVIICRYIHIFHDIHEDEIELAYFTNNVINIFK